MAKKAKGSSEKDTFKWSDDEAELLLKVTRDYKVLKASEGVDWNQYKANIAIYASAWRTNHWRPPMRQRS